MARHSRFREDSGEASKGHRRVGELLKEAFPICKIYQEYPMDLILKRGYLLDFIDKEFQDQFMLKRAKSLRVDWVVLDLCLIVEYHGAHHYQEVDYGDGKGAEAHQRRLHLDKVKRAIAKEAGFYLIEWPHFTELTSEALSIKIDEVFEHG